jgi:hypothetical protein
VKITRSVRRYGISDEAIRHAAANAMRVIDNRRWPVHHRRRRRRADARTGRTAREAGDLVVFHAMPLRPVNAKRYLP